MQCLALAFVVLNLPIFVPFQWNEDNKLSRPNYVALLPEMDNFYLIKDSFHAHLFGSLPFCIARQIRI